LFLHLREGKNIMSQQPRRSAAPYYAPPVQKKQTTSATPIPSKPPVPPTRTQNRLPQLLERLWKQTRQTLKGQFTAIAISSMLLSLVLAVFLSQSFRRASDDLSTIAYGSIPSVDAAQALAQYIDDTDAKSADFLGTAGVTTNSPCSIPAISAQTISGANQQQVQQLTDEGNQTVHQCDGLTINAELLLANQQLFNATHNVTYPGERTAIERITEGLEEYSGHIAAMMHDFSLAEKKGHASDPNDPDLQAAYQAYRDAGNVLHTQIERQPKTASGAFTYSEPANTIPTCMPNYPSGPTLQPNQWATGSLETNINCLSAINRLHLDGAYTDTQSFTVITIALTIILCVIFCGLLLFATVRMVVITHRVINPGLTLALVASIVLSITSISIFVSLQGNHGAYGQMVNDDYKSVYAADLLKRVGTNANADESRWLIALKFNNTDNADGVQHWQTDWDSNTNDASNPNSINSLLAQAQANRTWPEEDQPLADMQTNWNTYSSIDTQIRSAANSGDLQHAETISTGPSNDAFSKFIDAVDQLKKANYDHYYATLNTTQNILNVYILLSAIIFPLIGLATVWGVSRRFKDL
jgi:hypothetical protein